MADTTPVKKVAVITGAAKGIGKGIALALAREGCNIVVVDMKSEECEAVVGEMKALGVNAIGVAADISQATAVENVFKQAGEHFGRVDILVNNAGIYPFKPFQDLTEADWDKVMAVNLKGVFLACQAAAKLMADNSRIINISSVASLLGFEGLTHYCASKGGLNGLTRALALELAPRKITVNAVAPGAIMTPGASQGMTDQAKEQTIAVIPLKRMGEADDIAQAVAFLASDKASYITGQVLVVDGGWTLR